MKKYFVVTDIHSFYTEMIQALEEKGFDINNPDHIFVSLGDLLDRGPDPIRCLEFVNNFPKDRKILIRGNHEDLMEEALERGEFWAHDVHNGTEVTCEEIASTMVGNEDLFKLSDIELCSLVKKNELWNQYINSCVDYYELDKYVFVHGWIPTRNAKMTWDYPVYTEKWREGNWKRARWINGMDYWDKGIRIPDKIIYCGHYHCSWGNAYLHDDGKEFIRKVETMYTDPVTGKLEPHVNWEPFKDDGIVAMDACTAASGKVNCEVIEID